jgi:hypothetical protein
MINSKQKGAAYERQICVKLSRWVSGGKKDDLFWRSAMSGGRATVSAKRGNYLNNQAGDICAVGPEGHALTSEFYIECKFYKDLDLESFFIHSKGKLASFWYETLKQATLHGKHPMLIAKQNRSPDLLLASIDPVSKLSLRVLASPACRVFTKGTRAEVWLLSDVLSSPFTKKL